MTLHVVTAALVALGYLSGLLTLLIAGRHCGDAPFNWMFAAQVRHLRAGARTELERADERFHLAIEAAPTGMLMIDRAGRIVLVNAQAEKLFGYRRDELLNQQVEMLVPERLRSHHPDLRDSFFAAPQTRPMGGGRELYGLRKDGIEVPIEIGLNPLTTSEGEFVLSSIADITERKRATEQFRLTIEAAPTGMLLIDAAGRMILVNAQIEALFGYSRSELLGQPIEILVPERFRAHHPFFRGEFFHAPKARAMGGGRDLYGLRKDGSELPVEIGLNPLHTPTGPVVLSSIVDLSQRREVERLRTSFISTVSHELRTPLTSISGCLGLLQAGALGVLPEKADAMVRIAYKNSGRLVRIINDILDFGKLEAGEMTLKTSSIPLLELLKQSIEANGAYAQKYRVRFLLQGGSPEDRVTADADRLMQVLTNLLSNAAKFSPPNADVQIRLKSHLSRIRVEVEDSGLGIPETFQSRVFERFAQAETTANRRFEGTGLGLSISRKLVEAMGGSIGFSTVIGQGTIFYFELPRGAPSSETAQQSGPAGAAAQDLMFTSTDVTTAHAPGVPRILLVKDDPLIGDIGAALGQRAHLVAAYSSLEAERLLRGETFDLVMVEQSASDGTRVDLANRIAGLLGRTIPIVLLTDDIARRPDLDVSAVMVRSRLTAAQATAVILSYLPSVAS